MSVEQENRHTRNYFLNLPFDSFNLEDLKTAVLASAKKPFSYLVTPNVLHVVRAEKNSRLMDALSEAEYSVCDSQVLRMLARLRGIRLELVRGSDFIEYLFVNLNRESREQAVFGVVGSNAEQIGQLKEKYALLVKAHHIPPMGFVNIPEAMATAVDFIWNHPVDVWILAVGLPQQEYLAQLVAAKTGYNGVALCVGASLDFLSGVEKRAPGIVSSVGLEWLWRLLEDPRGKWRRYLVESPRVLWIFVRDIIGFGKADSQTPWKPE